MKLIKSAVIVVCFSMAVFINSCVEINKGLFGRQIVYLIRATPEQLKIWKTVIDEFMQENPDIEVKLQNVDAGNYWSKLQTMIAGGAPPDVVFMESYRVPAYALRDSLEDLAPYLEKSKVLKSSDFFEEVFKLYKYGDKIYGIPNDIAVYCMFYNKDMFDNCGIDYPDDDWTWNDFLEKAKKLTVDFNRDGFNDIYGFVYGHPFASFLWIWQNDAYLTNDSFNPTTVTITSSNFVQALQFYRT